MQKTKLLTLYSSNIPIDCHILKGRLETEGIPCFIFDEQIISVDPFRAVAIGGVKLKVPFDKYSQAKNTVDLIMQGRLIDENGEYQISEIYENEIKRQNEILKLKDKIRNDSSILHKEFSYKCNNLNHFEIEEILKYEREFQEISKKSFKFSWNQFLYELFDFDRSVFAYLRTKPVDYYIEKETVDNYINQTELEEIINCPKCNSDNTVFGYAIDYKWKLLYIMVSYLLMSPLFLMRKKFHCFKCGHNFKKQNNGNRL